MRRKRDHGVQGTASAQTKTINGRLWQWVHLSDGQNKSIIVSDLEVVPLTADPLADLAERKFGGVEHLLRRLTHLKLGGRLADLIYSLDATNTEFHAYQFKPLVKILNEASRGLLIADEVGLGKTIEAGLIWTELAARFDLRRLLVVCPKSLQEKWRAELAGKFAIRASIETADGVLQALRDPNAKDQGFALVSSLSALRPDRNWEEDDETARSKLAQHLRDAAGGEPCIDLLIVDEAHHLRNPGTLQNRIGRLLVGASDYRLMLSATPINLRSEDLRVLLSMLDPDLFEREWIFDRMEAENRPLIAARQIALTRGSTLEDLREAIAEAPRGELLQTSGRLDAILEQLSKPDVADGPALRSDVAAKLESMSLLGSIINRTRRRDVQSVQVKRRANVRRWTMNAEERDIYDRASGVISELALKDGSNERFLLSMPQRLLASSIPAALRHWRSARADFDLDEDEGERDPPGPLVSALSTFALRSDELKTLEATDSKLALLLTALKDTWSVAEDEKIIVFSSFRRTIDYLAEALSSQGVVVHAMHGSSRRPRVETLEAFEAQRGAAVLLTSEIGGEGLDLQFCRVVVNYDLPWNPMKVEQRIGRVDRIGQTSESIEVISLLASDTVEEQVYERLYERLALIERTLGGFEAILGPVLSGLEYRLMDPRLTPAEREEELDRASQQVEHRRLLEEQIESEAAGLIAHGDVILSRIQKAHDRQAWVQGEDIRQYVDEVLRAAHPGSSIERAPVADHVHEITLSWEGQLEFSAWLDRNARRFDTTLRRATERRRVRFGRLDDPRRERGVELISWTHPLVRYCADWRDRRRPEAASPIAVGARVAGEAAVVEPGLYAVAVELWSISGFTIQDRIAVAAARLESAGVSPLDEDGAAGLLNAVADARCRDFVPSSDLSRIAAEAIRSQVRPELARRWDELLAYEEADFEDGRNTRIAVFAHQRDVETRRIGEQIARLSGGAGAGILPALRGRLAQIQARIDRRIREVAHEKSFDFEEPKLIAVCVLEVTS